MSTQQYPPLLTLPADIIFEIFQYLSVTDLLQLTRTDKSVCLFLLDKDANYLWRNSRQAALPDVPKCPRGMSEARWTDLALVKEKNQCEICRTPADVKINVLLRGRFCRTCSYERCIILTELMKKSPILSEIVPSITNPSGEKVYRIRDVQVMHERLTRHERDTNVTSPLLLEQQLLELRTLYAEQTALDTQLIQEAQNWIDEQWLKDQNQLKNNTYKSQHQPRLRPFPTAGYPGHSRRDREDLGFGYGDPFLVGTCIQLHRSWNYA